MREVSLVIIGGGPAGLAAAIAAKEAGLDDILILERDKALGGILRQCIHNGFGLHTFKEELTGPEYAKRFIDRVNELHIPYALNTMVIDLTKERVITCVSPDRGVETIRAKAVVLAMGCRERPRGALGTPGTRPAGIFTAGTAQRFVNLEGYMPGKRVVILGSGDIGLIMARRMTFMGAKVLACVELQPYSSGLKRNIVQCLDDYNIPLMLSHTVTEIHGRERLEGVTVSAVDEKSVPIPGSEQYIACDTLLLSVGLLPENELTAMADVTVSPATGGAEVDETFETDVSGIFSCGNVLHVHDLVDHVSAESAKAGRNAAAFALGLTRVKGVAVPVEAGFGVGGPVPQRIDSTAEGDVNVMFRPRGVYRNATAIIRAGKTVLAKKRARIFTPGEMVSMDIKHNALQSVAGCDRITAEIEVDTQ